MGYKYTNDGKKVAVVGKLNDAEIIVQEVFVTESGAEVPSGENFVVKTLHDEPVISWRQKEIEDREIRYERRKKDLERLHAQLTKEQTLAKLKIKAARTTASSEVSEQLETVERFVSGEITHLFINSYAPKIVPFDAAILQKEDSGAPKDLRLISLFGRSDGDLEWRIHKYYDGSGGGAVGVHPATSEAHALEIATGVFESALEDWRAGEKRPRAVYLSAWSEVGIALPADLKEHNEKAKALLREEKRTELLKRLAKLDEAEKAT